MSVEHPTETKLQHYVEYFYPGAFFSESDDKKIEERNPEKVRKPKNAYGFRLYSRMECWKEGRLLQGPVENCSGMYYFDASVFTAKEAEKQFPNESILLDNLRNNKMSHIVKTKFGGFQQFNPKKDKIV
jgi:hypothetical protein